MKQREHLLWLDSISSRFNVLNMPIDQSAIAIGPYPGKNIRRFCCRVLRVNSYKCIIGTHIILVRVVRNTPLKTNILLKCSLILIILILIWISIILLFQFIWDFVYSAIIHMCLMSVMEFSRAEYSVDHSALFRRNLRNLRYRSSGCMVRVESCGHEKPLRGECTVVTWSSRNAIHEEGVERKEHLTTKETVSCPPCTSRPCILG
jgi:hypothetical protein